MSDVAAEGMVTEKPPAHAPGPWRARPGVNGEADRWAVVTDGPLNYLIAVIENGAPGDTLATEGANAHLFAAAPELLAEARVLRCLASSPRFQHITVAEALEEMAANGCGHDGGAAIAKAEGR